MKAFKDAVKSFSDESLREIIGQFGIEHFCIMSGSFVGTIEIWLPMGLPIKMMEQIQYVTSRIRPISTTIDLKVKPIFEILRPY